MSRYNDTNEVCFKKFIFLLMHVLVTKIVLWTLLIALLCLALVLIFTGSICLLRKHETFNAVSLELNSDAYQPEHSPGSERQTKIVKTARNLNLL